MKKLLISVIALAGLSGCTYYDYYKGGVRYTQDGDDCVYYAGEYGRRYSRDVRSLDDNKRIVYRNTRCEDLFAEDNGGVVPVSGRKILSSPIVKEEKPVVAEPTCPCANSQVAQIAPVAPVSACSSCGCNTVKSNRRVYTVTIM